jgi:uncharacterized protein YjbI with pentapeptide repeats
MAEEREQSWWQRLPSRVQATAIVGVAVAFVLVWWWVPPLLYAKVSGEDVRVKAITDTRTALLAGLVGLGALGTFWLNSRVYRLTARTFEVTERGHVTDRYSNAIVQLGSDSLDVRLGGIYALEQIAKDSARRREDQTTIVAVLSAFVRVHSDPIYRYKTERVTDLAFTPAQEEEVVKTANDYVTMAAKLSVDVQAAFTVLGRLPLVEAVSRGDLTDATLRRATTLHAILPGATLVRADFTEADLARANLTGADLTEAKLAKAMLSWADLTEADLRRANLSGAILGHAILAGANLSGANLSGAILGTALLSKAKLSKAKLAEANLTGANLSGAKLGDAILSKAKLAEADLTGADLVGANLSGAMVNRANLTGAMLNAADLTEAYLIGANLSRAELSQADLTGTHLTGANLSGANLAGTTLDGETPVRGLTQEQLDRALGDRETRLPAKLSRPETWDTQ